MDDLEGSFGYPFDDVYEKRQLYISGSEARQVLRINKN